jgi:hypothetical protein
MIGMSEINLGVELRFLQAFEQVCSVGEGIAVFLHDLVESTEVDTQSE